MKDERETPFFMLVIEGDVHDVGRGPVTPIISNLKFQISNLIL
jgi:hypothetical protein